MSILEEKIAFITERIKEMAKDILDDKNCEDRSQLKRPEQLA